MTEIDTQARQAKEAAAREREWVAEFEKRQREVRVQPARETIPLRQIEELAREMYSKEYDLASWWCESIAFRESWRDKAQAILEAKRG